MCWVSNGLPLSEKVPSRELTYPTWGKGKSSSKCHFWGDMFVSWRVFPSTIVRRCKFTVSFLKGKVHIQPTTRLPSLLFCFAGSSDWRQRSNFPEPQDSNFHGTFQFSNTFHSYHSWKPNTSKCGLSNWPFSQISIDQDIFSLFVRRRVLIHEHPWSFLLSEISCISDLMLAISTPFKHAGLHQICQFQSTNFLDSILLSSLEISNGSDVESYSVEFWWSW